MELREALCQISDIRRQMARSEVFRGYRSLTVGCSGVLALLAAALQPYLVGSPQSHLDQYLGLWVAVAVVSALVAGGEMYWRARVTGSAMARQMTVLAVEQFLPCLVIGAILTFIISRSASEVAWLLPGLWSLVFSLGIFASYRLLPRQVFWVGMYYVAGGVVCLLSGDGDQALAPWQMGLCFGGGQLLGAVILYWTLERRHVS